MATFSSFVGSGVSSGSSCSSYGDDEPSVFPKWKDMDTTAKKIGWIAGAIIFFPVYYLIYTPIKYGCIGIGKLCKFSFKLLVNDYTAKAVNIIFCKVIWGMFLAPIGRRIGQVSSLLWRWFPHRNREIALFSCCDIRTGVLFADSQLELHWIALRRKAASPADWDALP